MNGLVARDISVRFGGLVAVDGGGLEAPTGRITGLIGPNGAGKTTIFNVCCGFLRPNGGSVLLDDLDITHTSAAKRARLGLGRTFQRLELFRTLSVRNNIELAIQSLHIGNDPLTQLGLLGGGRRVRREARKRADELLELVGLREIAEKMAGKISTGQGRLLELARALARNPRLLLLDEPSSGLDATETAAFGALLQRIVDERDVGILLVEHDMELVLGICQWIYVVELGRPLIDRKSVV